MNITRAFVEYLETLLGITFGQGIYIGGAPLDAEDGIYWVTMTGGSPETKLVTGEMTKNYRLNVYYRDTDEQAVYDNLQSLEEAINADGCTELAGYDTMDMEAFVFSVDDDIDAEDRTVGLLQVNLSTHKE